MPDPAIAEIVIPRHCVPSGADGLSPLQARILAEPLPIRIFSAPTGAGKSYAFLRAVAQGHRVLFIVPTRRLAQNLARSLLDNLVAGGTAKSLEAAAGMLAIWTSDETARLKEGAPGLRIGRLRIRQVRGREGDVRMVIATPKSVAFQLLKATRPGHGAAPFALADLVHEFDHVVFDEFHAIDARGFGLCAAVATVCAAVPGGAKMTFLSATPVEIAPTLAAVGVDPGQIVHDRETVVSGDAARTAGMRAVHGNVSLRFEPGEDVATLLESHEADVRGCLASGRQVVAILDSVEVLFRSKDRIAAFLDRIGIPAHRRLAIDSIDDSTKGRDDGLFVRDRHAEPTTFDVLLATSSIEMGVTFRAGLIVMDPGHDALSFVQRIGRVARGDEEGRILIRLSAGDLDRRPWLRAARATFAADHPKGQVDIDAFLTVVLRAARTRFEAAETELRSNQPPATFRSMPARAVWAAMLFWHAMERAQRGLGQRRSLDAFRSPKVGVIAAKLAAVERASRSGKTWADAFLNEAGTLREIGETFAVIEPDGTRRMLPRRIVESHPSLASAPAEPDDESGGWRIYADRTVEDILSSDTKRWIEQTRDALFPDGRTRQVLVRDAARDWSTKAEQAIRSNATHPLLRAAFEGARDLVRMSGIVPTPPHQERIPPSAASVVLS